MNRTLYMWILFALAVLAADDTAEAQSASSDDVTTQSAHMLPKYRVVMSVSWADTTSPNSEAVTACLLGDKLRACSRALLRGLVLSPEIVDGYPTDAPETVYELHLRREYIKWSSLPSNETLDLTSWQLSFRDALENSVEHCGEGNSLACAQLNLSLALLSVHRPYISEHMDALIVECSSMNSVWSP